ncbi:SDR family NAD(P)-dependent oxidoreductase [Pseudonocardia oceani]|uniref:SDR family NAD(P)-dependent oxidoreductase n=1 Tax=Pseudonocardia oceani TaxID=2792013 RepID=UPI001C49E6A3|nr:SDR family NAD(P)-dependent oxidoreductase [Pseudonocardia oceani]
MVESKVIVITGASDGIGAAAAQRLHHHGHQVVVIGRSTHKTETAARRIGAEHLVADFTRLNDVRELATNLNASYPRIDVLANNAGGVFGDPAKTVDGFERTFQINHLAPFLLTRLLLPTLTASRATVIQTSSVGARTGELDLDDVNHDRDFSPVRVYTTSKLANILFTKELHRRHHAQGISAAAFHPGNVATSFGTGSASRLMRFITTNRITRSMMTTPEKGADQLVWLAESRPGGDFESGVYYEKRKPAKRINPQALDTDLARRLWERSEQLLG